VIFMHRELDEVLASQRAMLARRGELAPDGEDARMRDLYTSHLRQVERFMAGRACFRTLTVRYGDAVAAPAAASAAVARFLALPLDQAAMTGAIDGALYRNRA
jgi:hypothetical protein